MLRTEGYSERAIFVVDKTGVIRYVDVHDIETQPDNELLFRELADLEGVPFPEERIPARTSPPPAPVAAAAPQDDVALVMYCTDWCPACRRARAYLKINNINFKEINIARDREAAAQVRGWTGGHETTPVFDVKGSIVINFDVEKLNKLLGIQG